MKITRLRVTNYRGISSLDEEIAPAGAIISGANRVGKTSILNAIRAGLAARNIDEGDIRIGTDKAEVLIDLDSVSVRRVITPRRASLSVTNREGMEALKPQHYLAELLGTSPLDPLELLLAKPAARRSRVLEALPITVTLDQLRRWAPDCEADTSGHGLDVLSRVRGVYYDRRTAANKRTAEIDAEWKRLEAEATALASTARADVPLEAATRALGEAEGELARLAAQDVEATRAETRGASTRVRAEALIATAAKAREEAGELVVTGEELEGARAGLNLAKRRVSELELELSAAKGTSLACTDELARLEQRANRAKGLEASAASAEEQAADLRATLEAVAVARVNPATLADAQRACEAAKAAREAAKAWDDARQASARAERARASHAAAEETSERLDGIVRALTHDAPAELLAAAEAIPGLGLDGDDVTLDGKKLDALSGAEQMRFCVEIARRLNARSKILIVDGLERLDVDAREEFVRYATADGYQLLGTLVDRGAPVFAAIESSSSEAAAE